MRTIIKKAEMGDIETVQTLNLKLFEKECKDYDPLLNLDWTFGEEGTEYYKNLPDKQGRTLMEEYKKDSK